MKIEKLEAPHKAHINVTPMIDLIMCLIIFFLLAAQLSNDEIDAGIQLPKIRQAKKVNLTTLGERVIVNVTPADPAKGIKVKYAVRGHEYTIESIKPFLAAAVKKSADVKLALRPGGQVTYDQIQMLMVIAGQVQVKEVLFAASDAGGGG